MEPNRNIFVVVPAYNENTVLASTVDELLAEDFSVVVVDDGSSTPARDILGSRPVHYLRHLINLGQGAALQTGMEYALQQGAEAIVHFDADGQHDPSAIPTLAAPIIAGDLDVALASRFLDSEHARHVPALKRFVLKAGVVVSWIFTGVWLTDTHNGFRVLSRKAAKVVRLEEDGFAHATEILALVRKAGLRHREFPARVHYTEYSMAKGQGVLNSINILFDLVLRRLFQ
jgi:polyprenyl-phospho-N-acetylgalactosaminyl synthase